MKNKLDVESIEELRLESKMTCCIREYSFQVECGTPDDGFTVDDFESIYDVCRNSTQDEFADYFLDMMGYR